MSTTSISSLNAANNQNNICACYFFTILFLVSLFLSDVFQEHSCPKRSVQHTHISVSRTTTAVSSVTLEMVPPLRVMPSLRSISRLRLNVLLFFYGKDLLYLFVWGANGI